MEAGYVFSALFFIYFLFLLFLSEIIIKCVKGLSPVGDSRCQRYTKMFILCYYHWGIQLNPMKFSFFKSHTAYILT